jgi:hypothetical protein
MGVFGGGSGANEVPDVDGIEAAAEHKIAHAVSLAMLMGEIACRACKCPVADRRFLRNWNRATIWQIKTYGIKPLAA